MIGKLLGLSTGFVILGPMGALAGLFVGNIFDRGLKEQLTPPLKTTNAQDVFFDISFQIMGCLAKSDGRVNEQEIAVARAIMQEMHLSRKQTLRAMHAFNDGKAERFHLEHALEIFHKTFYGKWPLRQLFLEIQIKAAYADGSISYHEEAILSQIASHLGFSAGRLAELKQRFQAEQHFQQQGNSYQYRHQARNEAPRIDELKAAYALLEVPQEIDDEALKRAYRQQMSRHHPDKLTAKGLPPDMVHLATEKAKAIQAAYQKICKNRRHETA